MTTDKKCLGLTCTSQPERKGSGKLQCFDSSKKCVEVRVAVRVRVKARVRLTSTAAHSTAPAAARARTRPLAPLRRTPVNRFVDCLVFLVQNKVICKTM